MITGTKYLMSNRRKACVDFWIHSITTQAFLILRLMYIRLSHGSEKLVFNDYRFQEFSLGKGAKMGIGSFYLADINASSNFTDSNFDTPSLPIVTPYKIPALLIVSRLCVIKIS